MLLYENGVLFTSHNFLVVRGCCEGGGAERENVLERIEDEAVKAIESW